MLRASLAFFIIGVLAYAIGARNLAGVSAELGTLLLQVFVALSVLGFLFSFFTGQKPRLE